MSKTQNNEQSMADKCNLKEPTTKAKKKKKLSSFAILSTFMSFKIKCMINVNF